MRKFLLIICAIFAVQSYVYGQIPCATLDVGPDLTFCGNVDSIEVSMTVTNADSGVYWYTYGYGTFSDVTAATTIYYLDEYDKMNGVQLFADAYSSGGCNAYDTLGITVSNYPSLDIYNASEINKNEFVVCQSSTDSLDLYPYIYSGLTGSLSTSGDGTFSNAAFDNNSTNYYYYYPGIQDKENGLSLMFTADPFDGCGSFTDTIKVLFLPLSSTISADTIYSCSADPVVVSAITSSPDNILNWYNYGSGTMNINDPLNITFYPDSTLGLPYSVRLELSTYDVSYTCFESDNVELIFGAPDLSAGTDGTVCSSYTSYYLSGAYSNISNVSWTSTGTGSFDFSSSEINPYYLPTESDISTGFVDLILSGTTLCGTVSDSVRITFSNGPTVNAGPDQYVCAAAGDTIYLNGSATNTTYHDWYEYSFGTINDMYSLNTFYVIHPNDVTSGSLSFTLYANDASGCYTQDYLYVYFDNPYVDAGSDIKLCQVDAVELAGYGYKASSYNWTTTGTGTFSDPSDLYAIYTPSSADSTAGTIGLFLTATGLACTGEVSDTLTLSFNATEIRATVWSGYNGGTVSGIKTDYACSNSSVTLHGESENGYGIWSTINGTGSFPYGTGYPYYSDYLLSAEDKQRGYVTFLLTPVNTGTCASIADTIKYFIETAPVVEAGKNVLLSQAGVKLNGYTSDTTYGVNWHSSGTGYFSDPYSLNPVYYPSADDMASSYVYIDLELTGYEGECYPYDYLVLSNSTPCNVQISSSVIENSVYFEATNTDYSVIGAYFWDFGDGTKSSGIYQYHTYEKPGSYKVSLNYTTYDSTCYLAEYDTVTIASATKSVHFISGTVYAGTSVLDMGNISIFKYDGQHYHFLKDLKLQPTSKGNFVFSNLEPGHYLLFTGIDTASAYHNSYIPVYYGDAETWQNATVIQIVNSDLPGKNINMKPYTPSSTWNGSSAIYGVITFAEQGTTLKVNSGTGEPVENAVITLYSSTGDRLTSTYTDPFGNYSLEGIEAGNYFVGVEYPGDTTGNTSASISTEGSTSTVNTSVTKQTITLGLFVKKSDNSALLFPNPASSVVFIGSNAFYSGEKLEVTITNSMGQKVLNQTLTMGSGIDVNRLGRGLYIVEVKGNKAVHTGKFRKE